MSFTEAISRFIVGGSLVLIVSLLGKLKNPYISGLVVLFPVVTLVGYYFLSLSVTGQALQRVVLVSLFAVPTTITFLTTVYFTIAKMPAWKSLSLGLLAWLVTALILILLDRWFFHIMFKMK
ncbi:GlpM family protein [Lutispora sp.]|uniref:GlpM family protein n=1 Tax=Lutispora sp. TaxID=2828727 RepID=UPI002B1EC765|nr:GlpM family protein [Lutispora sp.]MEA4961019.1 GlpM family protein [Lutispora sp.]